MPSPAPNPAKKLGQLLVEQGWITGEQLIRAIQSQRVVGGRIGTCLLEMDVLTEDRLLEALSDQLRVPSARIDELRTIAKDTLGLIPKKVASRWQAVPFYADDTEIRVATLNATNLACLDDIGFCTNRRVLPHIANEVRIFEALEKYYNVECPRRYGHLLDRLNRSRYMWDEDAKILLGAGEAEWQDSESVEPEDLLAAPASRSSQAARSSRRLPPSDPTPVDLERLSTITWPAGNAAATRRDHSAAATNGGSAPEPKVLTLADVERLLANQVDQKSIGQLILRFLGQSFSRCAFFAIKNNTVRGWLLRGEGFDEAAFHQLRLTLDQPSAFLGLAKGAEFFLGPLAPMPAHRELARCLGGDLPQQCLMMPIRLRGRLISIVYVDRGVRGLPNIDIEQMKNLSEKAAIAFELCILRRKLQQNFATSPA
ncbi:MAG: hypothetical protein AAF657_20775 [Acidobacteriota bacterium]